MFTKIVFTLNTGALNVFGIELLFMIFKVLKLFISDLSMKAIVSSTFKIKSRPLIKKQVAH